MGLLDTFSPTPPGNTRSSRRVTDIYMWSFTLSVTDDQRTNDQGEKVSSCFYLVESNHGPCLSTSYL